VLAFNQTFMLVAVLAGLTTIYLACLILRHWLRREPLSSAAIALQTGPAP
jgi:hypothetical protein